MSGPPVQEANPSFFFFILHRTSFRRRRALLLVPRSPFHKYYYPPRAIMFARTRALARSLAPLGDRVLVRRAPKEVQTASGIYLPTDKTKDPNEGTVIAVGPGEKDVTGNLHAVNVNVGDTVLLPEYGGMKVKIDDDELFLFRETDILGKFE